MIFTPCELWYWIEGLHGAVMETDNLKDFDGLNLWWRDMLANGLTSISLTKD
jgi:hypothetical protein